MLNHLPIAMAVVASLIAALTDLRYYRIHNLLTIPLLFSGLVYWLLISGWWGLATSGGGAIVGFGTLIGLYLAGGMGAGDVKLMAGLGAWLGPALVSDVVLASCLAAGLYALGLLAWARLRKCPHEGSSGHGWRPNLRPGTAGDELVRLAAGPAKRRRLIPFGFVILVGLLTSLACSPRGPVLMDLIK